MSFPASRSSPSDPPPPLAADAPIDRASPDDEVAFERLFRTHYDALCIFAESYVRSAHVAEELVEDVFCWIWQHRAEWQVRDDVKAYLYGAVRNRALRVLARGRVAEQARDEALREQRTPGLGEPAPGPEARVEASELARAVAGAVAGLPPKCRETYLLHRQHEMSYAEIAAVMGTSRKTVENQLARAVKALRLTLAAWRG